MTHSTITEERLKELFGNDEQAKEAYLAYKAAIPIFKEAQFTKKVKRWLSKNSEEYRTLNQRIKNLKTEIAKAQIRKGELVTITKHAMRKKYHLHLQI